MASKTIENHPVHLNKLKILADTSNKFEDIKALLDYLFLFKASG
jgi:hypothetical protein